ncbi:MAG TPA: FAD-binding oxidoreductase [Jatrophihabitans sp.]|nr:FAD-binding oxidoreductase [Jatrophihabitans sp.]
MAEFRQLSGWGRTAPTSALVLRPPSVEQVAAAIAAAGPRGLLARGAGRSYGDAAQNAGGVVLDLAAFDAVTEIGTDGSVTCGAGVLLDTLLHRIVPAGWFLPVTPGTRQVTVGGAVAADVHGKNHHRDGSLGRYITRLELIDGLGNQHTLRPGDELFTATVGGMGLTGVITSVTLRLLRIGSARVAVDTWRTRDLDETMTRLIECDATQRYSVAWIDCLSGSPRLGRGVVTAGDHLPGDARDRGRSVAAHLPRPSVPGGLPRLVGRSTVAAFNAAVHRRAPLHATQVPTGIDAFFYPLDVVAHWNRVYGPAGFVQYQFATPDAAAVPALLRALQDAQVPVYLAVLKRFGPPGDGQLSFPIAGWTLALDIPAGFPGLGAALDAADHRVAESGGRVYLAKDARIRPQLVPAMYPQFAKWQMVRAAADPNGVFCSDLARRVHL